jgi:endonuclease/exonuclease/phosphatase family metal-dependent hydrolase
MSTPSPRSEEAGRLVFGPAITYIESVSIPISTAHIRGVAVNIRRFKRPRPAKWLLLPGAGLILLLLSCSPDPAVSPGEMSPTIEILSGPSGTVEESSVTFSWAGEDPDGRVVRYHFGLNDPHPKLRTLATSFTFRSLAAGTYVFYVRSEDDQGNLSPLAERSFEVQVSGLVDGKGQDNTLEITTWNIENFPLADRLTIDLVADIIRDLDIDVFAVQEIGDTSAFRDLIEALDGYQGLYSPDSYGTWYQKTGVIYKEDMVTVSEPRQLYCSNSYAFPRPPIEVDVVARHNGRTFDFRLIVLHLKAMGGSSNLDRRRRASQLLRQYLDSETATAAEKDFILAGDWNDEIDDPQDQNSFLDLLDTDDYVFLTWPLVDDPRSASYPGYPSLIDHILISEDALDEYSGGTVETLRLEEEVPGYADRVSDHRPVMVKFPVFQ